MERRLQVTGGNAEERKGVIAVKEENFLLYVHIFFYVNLLNCTCEIRSHKIYGVISLLKFEMYISTRAIVF